MNRNDLRSQSLDLLRFPLAVVVITIHVMYPNAYQEMGDSSVLNSLACILSGMLWDQSVPIYFFISGFVFFLNITLTKDVYIHKIRNRIKSLFIPYIIWNTAVILKLIVFTFPCFAFLFANQHSISDLNLSLHSIFMSFWNASEGIIPGPLGVTKEIYPQNGPLWFVRDLIIIVLCTPLIYRILTGNNKKATAILTILGIIWFIAGLYNLGHFNQLLTGFFFFSWGASMSIGRKDMLQEFSRYFKPAVLAYITLSIAYAILIQDVPEVSNALKKMNQCAGLIVAYNVSSWLIRKKVCRVSTFLASSSFFIYASNWLILYETKSIIIRTINPDTGLGYFICYILTIAIITCVLLTIFYVLRRYMPQLLKIIAGRKQLYAKNICKTC